MSRTRTHLLNAGGKRICLSPGSFHFLTACTTNARHVTHAKIGPARVTMSVDMPARNSNINRDSIRDVRVNLHIIGVFFHASP
jgi:hypothetical protein